MDGYVGQPFSYDATATGGVPPYRWTIENGATAPGITMSEAGHFSGTPEQAGEWGIILRVTDAAESHDDREIHHYIYASSS